jgi:hypothetical protein
MGQAAGTAAALALRRGGAVHEVSVAELQSLLRRDGAWLGDGDPASAEPVRPAA